MGELDKSSFYSFKSIRVYKEPKVTWFDKAIRFIGIQNKNQSAAIAQRINRLEKMAQERLVQLQQARDIFKAHTSPEAFCYVERIVNSMERKEVTINRKTPEEKLELYQQWIYKAEQLVKVLRKHDSSSIIDTVVNQILRLSSESITTHLKTIKDYKKHRVLELDLKPQDKERLNSEIDAKLNKVIERLKLERTYLRAKRNQRAFSIDEAIEYHTLINKRRQLLVNEAHDVVDKTIEKGFDDGEHPLVLSNIRVNLNELAALEENVPKFLEAINNPQLSEERRAQLQEELIDLEEDVAELEDFIELTPEIKHRLEKILRSLEEAHQLFFLK